MLTRHHGFSRAAQLRLLSRAPVTLVYAISDGSAIKIGKTDGHPIQRLRSLQTGNPRPLRLLAYTQGQERLLHTYFSQEAIHGEWFKPSLRLLQEVAKWDWVNEGLLQELTTKELTNATQA